MATELLGRPGSGPAAGPVAVPRRSGKSWSTQFAAAVRWLHIYVSLLAFSALVFFGLTGITLNHPDWFGADAQRVQEFQGEVNLQWVALPAEPVSVATASSDVGTEVDAVGAESVRKLEVVEHLRAAHKLRGAVSEFRIDEYECLILFKGPGYAADAIVDRASGSYNITVTMLGAVAWMNDLHKGRDTGTTWSVVIDVVSLVTVFVSATGLVLIFYIRRKRMAGLLTTIAGTVLLIGLAVWCVP